jgi:hypothetical protein
LRAFFEARSCSHRDAIGPQLKTLCEEHAMKASQALIFWTPRMDVVVTDLADGDPAWGHLYDYNGGAAQTKTRSLRGDAGKLQLFIDFHTLVVRDGIDPRQAHEAFMAIDEYRDCIAPGIEDYGFKP